MSREQFSNYLFFYQLVILLVDGPQDRDQVPYTPLSRASKPLRDRDIVIYAIGVRPYTPESELEDLTSDKTRVFFYPIDELPKRTPQVLNRWYDNWLSRSRPTGKMIICYDLTL